MNTDFASMDGGGQCPKQAGRVVRIVALAVAGSVLVAWASAPVALVAGMVFALVAGHPIGHESQKVTRWLLQGCVVLLGFGMDLPLVLRLGLNGSLFAAVSIGATLAVGWWLGGKFKLNGKTSALISAGTAICGGSAIAAVSSVIGASEAEIAVSIGTVFLLNAVALYVFPPIGHLLHLTQGQFGVWAGVAIHDISSVVGAGLSYGTDALNTAAAVKLSRTLWIVPLTLVLALAGRRMFGVGAETVSRPQGAASKMPWFIGLFLVASLVRSGVPLVVAWSPTLLELARRGMILVLFLIGTSLSVGALKTVGWRMIGVGLALWLFIAGGSLAAILFLKIGV